MLALLVGRWPWNHCTIQNNEEIQSWAASDLGDDSCWCFMVDSKKGGFIVKHPTGINQVVVGEIEMIQFDGYIFQRGWFNYALLVVDRNP